MMQHLQSAEELVTNVLKLIGQSAKVWKVILVNIKWINAWMNEWMNKTTKLIAKWVNIWLNEYENKYKYKYIYDSV